MGRWKGPCTDDRDLDVNGSTGNTELYDGIDGGREEQDQDGRDYDMRGSLPRRTGISWASKHALRSVGCQPAAASSPRTPSCGFASGGTAASG
jgi:hypothetical protein